MNVWGLIAPLITQLRHGTQGKHFWQQKSEKSTFSPQAKMKNLHCLIWNIQKRFLCVLLKTHVFPDKCAFKARNDSSVLSNELNN